MDNRFTRGLVGFVILSCGVAALATLALYAVTVVGWSDSWVGVVPILIALAAEIGVYSSTLHGPVHKWINDAPNKGKN